MSRETHDASRQISTGIEIHGTTVRFTVKQGFRRASNRIDSKEQGVVDGLLRFTPGVLSKPLLKSTSTAR